MYQTVTMTASRRSDDPDLVRWTVRRTWFEPRKGTHDRVVASGQFYLAREYGDPNAAVRRALRDAADQLERGRESASGDGTDS